MHTLSHPQLNFGADYFYQFCFCFCFKRRSTKLLFFFKKKKRWATILFVPIFWFSTSQCDQTDQKTSLAFSVNLILSVLLSLSSLLIYTFCGINRYNLKTNARFKRIFNNSYFFLFFCTNQS
jgi:hypothetical protein